MKCIFLFVLGCLLCSPMRAQHQQVFEEYRREAGDWAEMFVGKVEVGYASAAYKNLPYLLSDDFVSGDVMYNDLWYKNVRLRYDAYQKQLVVNTPEKQLNICVPMHAVNKFVLDGTDYERRDGEMVAILFSGSGMELIEHVNVYVAEELVNKMSFKYRFVHVVKYYMLRDGRRYEVGNLRSITKLFPDMKKELKRFVKINRLDFSEHRKSSLISLIKYADKLLVGPLN